MHHVGAGKRRVFEGDAVPVAEGSLECSGHVVESK